MGRTEFVGIKLTPGKAQKLMVPEGEFLQIQQIALAGPAKPKCNKAHGLAALHTRLNAAYYVSAPQVLGDMHRMGLGKTVTTHSATRTALLAVAPPMEALAA